MDTTYVHAAGVQKPFLKDPGSAVTHFIGAVFSIVGTAPLIIKASRTGNPICTASMTIFIISMILLYSASTIYHSLDISEKVNRVLRKIDHMMIFILIAGSYTPICLVTLRDGVGPLMCVIVWSIAALGLIIKACWITCPKWFSSVIYIGMGWTCLMGLSQILDNLSPTAFAWLLAGGIIYTLGGVIYALKLPIFNSRHRNFGSHEIFHLFVMAGSLCHYILMYSFVAA